MTAEQLTQRLLSWSVEKLAGYTNIDELPKFEDRSRFIQEYDANGLYSYNQHHISFYGNDGQMMTLDRAFTDLDVEIYHALYTESVNSEYKFYKLIDSSIHVINGEQYQYLNFASPTGRLGIPWMAEEKFDTEYIIQYIKHIEFIILTLERLGYPYPQPALPITKLTRDPIDNLYYFCPNLGPNNIKFNLSRSEFVKLQLQRAVLTKQTFSVALAGFDNIDIDWAKVKAATLAHWKIHRNK